MTRDLSCVNSIPWQMGFGKLFTLAFVRFHVACHMIDKVRVNILLDKFILLQICNQKQEIHYKEKFLIGIRVFIC